MNRKFYRCAHCGNIIAFVNSSGVPVMCCGEKMQEIVPGTVDAAVEKHVPVCKIERSTIFSGCSYRQSSAISAASSLPAARPQ